MKILIGEKYLYINNEEYYFETFEKKEKIQTIIKLCNVCSKSEKWLNKMSKSNKLIKAQIDWFGKKFTANVSFVKRFRKDKSHYGGFVTIKI